MAPPNGHKLEEAKALFYSWRLPEAYTAMRRFFDRLPFNPEPAHAEYISMFARVLAELGKSKELQFYRRELERLHPQNGNAHLTYALAFCYAYVDPPRWETARALFEQILADPNASAFHAKAKMMLADYYVSVRQDLAAATSLISSIELPSDPNLRRLVLIWRAKCLRDAKEFRPAQELYQKIIREIPQGEDWYSLFSAKVGLAILHIRTGAKDEARNLIREVRELIDGKNLKSSSIQLARLEEEIREAPHEWRIVIEQEGPRVKLIHGDRALTLKEGATDRLLLSLMEEGFLEKAGIAKVIGKPDYQGVADDPRIYHHIHSARRMLKRLGLPTHAIVIEQSGYRFVPKVDWVGRQSETS